MRNTIPALILTLVMSAPAAAAESASGTFHDSNRKKVGTVDLRETPNGVLVEAELHGLPPGEHGFHIHETGRCDPPFESAGSHFAPGGTQHGFEAANGPHAGDLPNVFVPESGPARVHAFAEGVKLADLLDGDGAALVVHEGPDDYETDPAGAAGDRIACAALER